MVKKTFTVPTVPSNNRLTQEKGEKLYCSLEAGTSVHEASLLLYQARLGHILILFCNRYCMHRAEQITFTYI